MRIPKHTRMARFYVAETYTKAWSSWGSYEDALTGATELLRHFPQSKILGIIRVCGFSKAKYNLPEPRISSPTKKDLPTQIDRVMTALDLIMGSSIHQLSRENSEFEFFSYKPDPWGGAKATVTQDVIVDLPLGWDSTEGLALEILLANFVNDHLSSLVLHYGHAVTLRMGKPLGEMINFESYGTFHVDWIDDPTRPKIRLSVNGIVRLKPKSFC